MENYAANLANMPDKKLGFLYSAFAPQKGRDAQKVLYCDVVFGSPTADCRGTGVCKISAHSTLKHAPEQARCKSTTVALAAGENGTRCNDAAGAGIALRQYCTQSPSQGSIGAHRTLSIAKKHCTKTKPEYYLPPTGYLPVKEVDGNYKIEFQ